VLITEFMLLSLDRSIFGVEIFESMDYPFDFLLLELIIPTEENSARLLRCYL
jgi:hypothetical protein